MGSTGATHSPEKAAFYARFSQSFSDEITFKVLDFLRFRQAECLVAPYESDAQLAHLYHTKRVEFVLSEDSDMFAFGIRRIVKGLRADGRCLMMDLESRAPRNPHVQRLVALDPADVIRVCVAAGCDYLDNVKNIGFLKALEAMESGGGMARLRALFATQLTPAEVTAHVRKLELACATFTHQLVWSPAPHFAFAHPDSQQSDLPRYAAVDDYIGRRFGCGIPYSRGERTLDDETVARKPSGMDFAQLLRFFNYIPRPETGFLRNMTARTIGMENFAEFQEVVDRSDNEEFLSRQQTEREEVIARSRDVSERRRGGSVSARSERTTFTLGSMGQHMLCGGNGARGRLARIGKRQGGPAPKPTGRRRGKLPQRAR